MSQENSIAISLKEYGRGIIGGLLFSLPMLYTMELWWAGFLSTPSRLLIYLFVGIFLLMVYNHYVGLRKDRSLFEGFMESLEEMGLGILLTIFILYITGRILPEMSYSEISGKIIIEAVTVAIGISVGKSQLGGDNDENEEDILEDKEQKSSHHPLIRSINLALCGAILVASNVAPTEEIIQIALESDTFKVLIIAVLSIAMGGAVLYHINFKGAKQWVIEPDNHWDILAGTLVMYAVALVSSAFMLWFFNRFDGISVYGMVAQTVVLGFPATLGASAGRLLIQP